MFKFILHVWILYNLRYYFRSHSYFCNHFLYQYHCVNSILVSLSLYPFHGSLYNVQFSNERNTMNFDVCVIWIGWPRQKSTKIVEISQKSIKVKARVKNFWSIFWSSVNLWALYSVNRTAQMSIENATLHKYFYAMI